MRNTVTYFVALALAALLVSCEKDTFDFTPNARMYGSIRDMETGELVRQDIVNGSKIYFFELGYSVLAEQSMVIKNDGTYHNNLMFANDYKIILNKGNFIPTDTIDYRINKGDNQKDFEVMPYIRIVDPKIRLDGERVVATFKLKQNTSQKVKSVSLFVHPDITVGYSIQIFNVTQTVDAVTMPDQEFELVMNVPFGQTGGNVPRDKSYYFIIGALSSANEAKHNYCMPVNLDL